MATATVERPARARKAQAAGQDRREVRRAVGLLKMAADETRLGVLLVLAEGERCVGDLCGQLGMAQPAVSHHLNSLRLVGLVEAERRGKFIFYGLTETGEAAVKAARVVMGE